MAQQLDVRPEQPLVATSDLRDLPGTECRESSS